MQDKLHKEKYAVTARLQLCENRTNGSKMKIAMIGAGYVGLVSGVCFSDFGHTVVCVDKNQSKLTQLNSGEVPIFEPGLKSLMQKNVTEGRLSFTDDIASALADADAVFIAVGTPARADNGHADLSYVYATAKEIGENITSDIVVVTKSTVPVGTNRKVAEIIAATKPSAKYSVASNPEFLREGSAIDDFMHPDRVVIGVENETAEDVLRRIYRPLSLKETPLLVTDLNTAEIIKYAANAFLATKITFINEIADLCEVAGGDVQMVSKGIGMDDRIGSKFLQAGPGYGGSCFPKDTQALGQSGREFDAPQTIVETVIKINEERKTAMAQKIIRACGGSVKDKKIAVLGVTFKPNTDDMRDAPSLVIIPALQAAGAQVVICDPEGRKEGEKLLPGCAWVETPYLAAKDADAVALITEWNIFRGLDLDKIAAQLAQPVFIDLRNIYHNDEVSAAGLKYTGVGKGAP